MFNFLQIILLVSCLTGCQTSNSLSPAEKNSVQSNSRLVGIDAYKWNAENKDTATERLTVYGCNSSICPQGTAVSYLTSNSKLAQYGPKVIELTFKDARVQLEKEGAVFSTNHVTHFKGYNALKREYRKDYNGTLKFFSSINIFTQNTQVVIASASNDAKSAQKYRDEFASKLQIKNAGSAQPAEQ